MTETTELTPFETTSQNGLMDDIDRMQHGQTNVMSTFTGGDRASKLEVLKAMSNSTPLDAVMDQEIELANFVIQPIEMEDEKTGNMVAVPRIILVTTDGTPYYAISSGIFSALKNISGILGMPGADTETGEVNENWPVKVVPSKEKTSNKFTVFTLKITG